MTQPLWENMLADVDDLHVSTYPSVRLNFAHLSTIMPLLRFFIVHIHKQRAHDNDCYSAAQGFWFVPGRWAQSKRLAGQEPEVENFSNRKMTEIKNSDVKRCYYIKFVLAINLYYILMKIKYLISINSLVTNNFLHFVILKALFSEFRL